MHATDCCWLACRLHRLSCVLQHFHCAHSYIIRVALRNIFITSNQLIQVFCVSFTTVPFLYPIVSHSATYPPHFFINISVVLFGHGRSPDIAYTVIRILHANTHTHTHTHTCLCSCITLYVYVYVLAHIHTYIIICIYTTHNMYIHINKPKNCLPNKCFLITIVVRFVFSQIQNTFNSVWL